jgi:hypothetical protein
LRVSGFNRINPRALKSLLRFFPSEVPLLSFFALALGMEINVDGTRFHLIRPCSNISGGGRGFLRQFRVSCFRGDFVKIGNRRRFGRIQWPMTTLVTTF